MGNKDTFEPWIDVKKESYTDHRLEDGWNNDKIKYAWGDWNGGYPWGSWWNELRDEEEE